MSAWFLDSELSTCLCKIPYDEIKFDKTLKHL